jgi:undecaprenyl diphosphate synthase
MNDPETLKIKIDPAKLPQHIAIIMDGNGRWASQRGEQRVFGHHNGVESIRQVSEACAEIGVKYLTLYAFSTENWNRPKEEVDALMHLLVVTINNEISTLNKNKIRLKAIGDLSKLNADVKEQLFEAIEKTRDNDHMCLILALNYSGRWEIADAVKKIAAEIESGSLKTNEICQETISEHLDSYGIPDPELMIRTSGEYRLSNFLLWQTAYSEFFFSPVLWPDFRKEHLYEAILNFQKRERRFGLTSEQIITTNE